MKRPLKILMIIPVGTKKKGETRISPFLQNEMKCLEDAGMTIIPLMLSSRYDLKVLNSFGKNVQESIKTHQPDLIHVQTGTAGGFLFFTDISIPVVLTIGGSELLGYPGKGLFWMIRGKLARELTRRVCALVDQTVVVSSNLLKPLPRNLSRRPVVVPRSVNTTVFKPMNSGLARKCLGWTSDKIYVLFSDPRPFMNVKNRPLAEKVISLAKQTVERNIELVILTNIPSHKVHLMLCASNALLVTSLHEGSPNIVKESMACNLPVVSVPCGDVVDRLNGVKNSGVCSYDATLLSALLARILINGERSNGLEILNRQGLTNYQFAKKMETLYGNLL